MFFQKRRYKFDKECAYHSYCNYIQKVYPYAKFTRDNDRSLHQFYTFLWNQKHPFLFLGRTMLVSLLPVLDVYNTNYFVCKNQNIYCIIYNKVEKVFAILDSNDEQVRYDTSMELYMELTNAEYVFMELNKSISSIIIQKLIRMENKNNYYRANCMNIRMVVQNYDNSIVEESNPDTDVMKEMIMMKKTEDSAKKFEMEILRQFNRLKKAEMTSQPEQPIDRPKVERTKVERPKMERPVGEKSTTKNNESVTKLCNTCGTSSSDYLTERRIARKVIPSKQTAEYSAERKANRANIQQVVKVIDPEKLKEMYPDAKSPTYYRNLRQTTRKDKDIDPLRKKMLEIKSSDV
jgi:hypothetical protein